MKDPIASVSTVRNFMANAGRNTCNEYLYEALKDADEALQSQIPKKIHHERWVGINGVPYDQCPRCKANLCTAGPLGRKKENYCGTCGQKLDWEES